MHFINALQSPAVQYDLTEKSPKTLDEALHFASVREMFFGVESQSEKLQNMPINVRSINTRNQFPCQNTNQWPAPINNAANWSHPEYNMFPQQYYYAPQLIPKVSQPGQWNGSPPTCGNTQGVVPQPAINYIPVNNSHMYDQATANHGKNYLYYIQYQESSRGTGNFQPISQ